MKRSPLYLSPREVLVRGGQRVRQQADRLMTWISPGWQDDDALFGAFDLNQPDLLTVKTAVDAKDYTLARAQLLKLFKNQHTPRFFFKPDDLPALLDKILKRCPEAGKAALRRGEMALEGRTRLLGLEDMDLGAPIHWQRDPITHRDWPADFWADIDYLNDPAGDPKWVWEMNRHTLWLDLARAFAWSGEMRFAQGFAAQLESWMEQNPPGRGLNWSCALETAHRLIAWQWIMNFLLARDGLEPDTLASLLRGILASARYTQAYLSTYTSPNTHLIGEAAGLFITGLLIPQFREARHWRELGAVILSEEFRRQFHEDGVHFEQSAHYHRYATDFYVLALLLADANKFPFLTGMDDMLGRMLEYLAALSREDGSLPRLGDDDGGRVIFLGEEPVWDCRSTLAAGAGLLGRGDLKGRFGDLPEQACWLLGLEGIERWEALKSEKPEICSKGFAEAGLYSFQNEDGDRLLFRCGSQGWKNAGHGHADLLGIEWQVGGTPVLIDPGTFVYNGSPRWRSHFRGTGSHNTVRVDGLDQADEVGTFAWRDPVKGYLRRWVSSQSWDLIEGGHSGYRRLASPVEHRRAVLFLKGEYTVICDLLTGQGEHQLEQHFQFAPGETQLDPESCALSWRNEDGLSAWVVPVDIKGISAQVVEGSEHPISGWASPVYGVRVSTPSLCYERDGKLPLSMPVLLVPSAKMLPSGVDRLQVERAGIPTSKVDATGLRIIRPDSVDYLVISHAGAGAHSAGSLDMDGEMALIRMDRDGHILRACLANGTALSWKGSLLCQADSRFKSITIDYVSNELQAEPIGSTDLKICGLNGALAINTKIPTKISKVDGCVLVTF